MLMLRLRLPSPCSSRMRASLLSSLSSSSCRRRFLLSLSSSSKFLRHRDTTGSTACIAIRASSTGTAGTGSNSTPLQILPEVSEAIRSNRPVVALESTIIAHGMPYPQNLDLSRDLASILRNKGVVPATVAVKGGVCRIGLSEVEMADLAVSGQEKRAGKCSTRDLPLLLARNGKYKTVGSDGGHQWGATTVASTMKLANLAGISTFVTGGTGGVHRGAETTLDISADLYELARTPVVVVSAGVKSILDIKLTLEQLETFGVPAMAYGTDEFPAFFSPNSGIDAPLRVDNAGDVARAYWSSKELDLPNGMLVAVPNNDPAGESVESAIHEALVEAEAANIAGRDVTPFILERVADKTSGDSLRSNIALVKKNASVGADIATAIAVESAARANKGRRQYFIAPSVRGGPPLPTSRVIVMGGAVIDLLARPMEGHDLIMATSNPGVVSESDGGVGRNVAEALGRLGACPILYTAVGSDSLGHAIVQRLEDECGVVGTDTSVSFVSDMSTSTYLAVMNSVGDLHTAIADMSALSRIPIPPPEILREADILVMDANAPVDTLVEAAHSAVHSGVKVFFEPTSVPKAAQLGRRKDFLSYLSYGFPNVDELMAMADGWIDTPEDLSEALHDNMKTIKYAAEELLEQMQPDKAHLVITMGKEGVLLASKLGSDVTYEHIEAAGRVDVQNSTGAGDTLCGAFVHALLEGEDETKAVRIGMDAAVKSLGCADRAISPDLRKE
mmetsp:Transcript_14950/g.33384  ORF Transcript_14950/g.33384 Transcript_14950/m.33384 type:complete len:733 (+) Transcript_14950:151-2349(+)